MKPFLFYIVLLFTVTSPCFAAPAKEICVFVDQKGTIKQVNSRAEIPPALQSTARCLSQTAGQHLAQPEEVKLTGNIRREDIGSSIGQIQLRWPRKVELLFGRTPQRAMSDAASTASRALKAASFPIKLQNLNLDWKVVFMDEKLPETQIPAQLISNCHPAWMTPPANIYVVAQRVVAGCGGQRMDSKVADSELAHILLHEIGHAVEHQLLKDMQGGDRMRAEGFASWFEQYASNYSSIIPKGSMQNYYFKLAKQSFKEQPVFTFTGSAHDYARASIYFHAIEERRGVRGLMEVYETMAKDGVEFFTAISKKIQWDEKKMQAEVERALKAF